MSKNEPTAQESEGRSRETVVVEVASGLPNEIAEYIDASDEYDNIDEFAADAFRAEMASRSR